MNIFLSIIAVCIFSFLLFQFYNYLTNYYSIMKFNRENYALQYGDSNIIGYIDSNIVDPNDFVTDVNSKFRCILSTLYYPISENGFYSNVNNSKLGFRTIDMCVNYLFNNTIIKQIYNPCILNSPNSNISDCGIILTNI